MNQTMNPSSAIRFLCLAFLASVAPQRPALGDPFEGRITATLTRGSDTKNIHYTVSADTLRIERTENNWPHAKNLMDRGSGAVTVVYPHNRSFVRLKPSANNSSVPPGFPAMPALQSGIGAQTPPTPPTPASLPPGIGPQSGDHSAAFQSPPLPKMLGKPTMPSMPMGGGMPAMPMMPMPGKTAELKVTTNTMSILGYECVRYDFTQRGELMEIWATDQLLPFEAYQQNRLPRFGLRSIEDQWSGLLKEKKLFPLRAVLRMENGPERLRFEVASIKPEKIQDRSLFQPPADYHELEPLPF